MSDKRHSSGQAPADAAALRRRAEEQARAGELPSQPAQTPEEIRRLLHDLRVHQIELEMQNEELRRAQAEIEAGRARYFDLFDLAPVGYCTLSEQGLVLEANLTAAAMLGTDRGALVKQPISRFILREDQDIYYLHRKQLFEAGEPRECELRLVKPDGTVFWAHLASTTAQTEDGAPLCRVTISDITERKRGEEQIRFQADIIDNSPVIAAYHDKDLNVVWVNQAYQKATGLSLEEVRGRKCYQVWKLSKPCRGCPVITAIETGESAASELTPGNQDHWPETQGYWLSRAAPVRDEQGTVIGALEFAIDITERKQAEAEREKLLEQLHKSQKLDSVGRLAGGLAHDFNNMLQAINGNAELALRKSSPADPIREYLEDILGAGRHSVDLIRSLLAFARKQVIAPRRLDLNETVAGMLKIFKPMLGEDIELAWEPAPEPAPVKLDPTQISQILTNLLTNARDAVTGVGKVAIRVGEARFDRDWCRNHPEYRAGRWITLEVTDTGRGMDREVLSRLFEPFFTTKEVGRGTGLGLPSVYGIVTQNEGFITAESEPGQGSTFRIFFPPAPESTREPGGWDQPGPPPGGTETVLLVEDEPAVLKLGRRNLEQLGYTVLAAGSPETARRLADNHPGKIDLLIADVVMPEMNGRDLWEKLLERRPGLACLFVSGFTADVIAHRQILDKEMNFLPKPFTLEQLARAVRSAIPVAE